MTLEALLALAAAEADVGVWITLTLLSPVETRLQPL